MDRQTFQYSFLCLLLIAVIIEAQEATLWDSCALLTPCSFHSSRFSRSLSATSLIVSLVVYCLICLSPRKYVAEEAIFLALSGGPESPVARHARCRPR